MASAPAQGLQSLLQLLQEALQEEATHTELPEGLGIRKLRQLGPETLP